MNPSQVARRVLYLILTLLVGIVCLELYKLYRYNQETLISPVSVVDDQEMDAFAYNQGKDEGARDLQEGKLIVRVFGGPMPDKKFEKNENAYIFRKYGIRIQRVAGCIVTGEVSEATRGYNEIMDNAIEKRLGTGVIRKLWPPLNERLNGAERPLQ
jgi:hypothetical protein